MKFLKGLFTTILVLVVLLFVGAYFFLKNFDVNKYRPQITAEISKQTGRQVVIDHLSLNLSLLKGVYAQADGIKMNDDSAYAQGDFLSVESAQIGVDVMAYFSRKEIVVTKVVVSGLNVTIIRDAQGMMNVQKIGPAPAVASETQIASTTSAAPAAPPSIPPFIINKMMLENGTVVFIDRSMNPPMIINVSKVDFNIIDFSLKSPFSFAGQAAVLGTEQNVSFKGQGAIDMTTMGAKLSDMEAVLDLGKLSVAELVKAVASLEAAGLTGQPQGKVIVQVPSLTVGASGLGALVMNGKFVNGSLSTKMLPVPVEKINADFSADAKDFTVTQFSLQLSTGVIAGTAKISDYMQTMGLNTQVKVTALPLGSLVANLPEGMVLAGAAEADMTVNGQNLANPELFMNSLNGSGQFHVKDGKIENFNVLKTLLSRIDVIPGLAASIEAGIPEKYRAEFEANQTIFQKLGSSIQITNGVVDMPDMQVLSSLFEANMRITADAQLNGKVGGQIKMPVDLSESLAAHANALNYLRDDQGKITISIMSFEGPLASMKILPDVKQLVKVAAQGEGKRQLGNLIDKALGVENTETPEGEEPAAKPGEQIIGGVLNKIFK